MSPPKKRLDDPRNALGGTKPLVNDGGKDLWGGNANPRLDDLLFIIVKKLVDNWQPAKLGNDIENMTSDFSNDELFALARAAIRQHEERNKNRVIAGQVSEIIKNPKEPYTVEDFRREHEAGFGPELKRDIEGATQIRETPFGSPCTAPPWPEPPLTRRERYAMAAMQGLLSNPVELAKFRTLCVTDEESLEDYLAGMCFIIADAMLKAGGKS